MDVLTEFFSRLYHFDALIRWGGPAVLAAMLFAETGLLAGFFLPGDSLLVTAGLLASVEGRLDLRSLIPLLSLAVIAGDNTGYAIGYHLGPRLFHREDSRFFRRDHLRRTQQFYARYGVRTILLARFVPIVRTFAPTVAGVGRMRYRTFLAFSLLGGVGWVGSLMLAGFWLGRSIPGLTHQLHWVIAIVVGVSFLPILREWWLSRRAPQVSRGPSGSDA